MDPLGIWLFSIRFDSSRFLNYFRVHSQPPSQPAVDTFIKDIDNIVSIEVSVSRFFCVLIVVVVEFVTNPFHS